jgi:hypothetical protein
MSKKKKWPAWIWLIVIAGVAVIILAVWWIIARRQPVNVDELGRDNFYHYRNQDLNFNLDLPEQFIYYQTERINAANYTEIKFFVPTGDPGYIYEAFPSYAKSIVVRVYQEDFWNKLDPDNEGKLDFQKIKVKDERVYSIWFWDQQPKDWQGKWNNELKETIIQSLK